MALGPAAFLILSLAGWIEFVHSFVPTASFIFGRPNHVGKAISSCLSEPGRSYVAARMSVQMTGDNEVEYVKADDGDALQALFSKFCNEDGLMTKEEVRSVPVIAELLKDGDLLLEELDDIWKAAPKFPDVDDKERVDVDSFIQIYRDIDDVFEDDDGVEDESPPAQTEDVATKEKETGNVEVEPTNEDSSVTEDDETTVGDEKELEVVFESICDEAGLASRDAVRTWDEVADLIAEGMLGEDEFDRMWKQTAKSPGATDQLDLDGFLSFNVALDDLFVFDDDDNAEEEAVADDADMASGGTVSEKRKMVVGDDLPPGVIFAELADDDFLVSFNDLQRWAELQEMLDEGDLLPLELQNMFEQVTKAPGTSDKLNEDGFIALYDAIDAMFEDVDEEEELESASPQSIPEDSSVKPELLAVLAEISDDEELLPCGLESTDREQAQILNMVTALEAEPSNIVQQRGGRLDQSDLTGEWELLYSSSSAMKFNQGLSGLGGSFPNGKFGGLRQKLQASKYMSDIEYIEKINIPGGNSFDVTVTGDWKLKGSINIFSGEPTTTLNVEPDRVEYSFTSTRADHWKSLGPLNVLDITYLDDDLRIMRGNTSTDTVFVFRRC